jgi:hypothetical protein
VDGDHLNGHGTDFLKVFAVQFPLFTPGGLGSARFHRRKVLGIEQGGIPALDNKVDNRIGQDGQATPDQKFHGAKGTDPVKKNPRNVKDNSEQGAQTGDKKKQNPFAGHKSSDKKKIMLKKG